MNQFANIKTSVADTLQDAIDFIDGLSSFSARRRRDLVSDLKSVARILGRHPSEIALDVPMLRTALQRVNPGVHNISSKRFTNIRSSLDCALRLVRVLPRKRPKPPKTSAWQAYWDRIPKHYMKARVTRFIDYCLFLGIEPEDVTDATVAMYRSSLERTSIYKCPTKVTNDSARMWNYLNEKNYLGLAILSVSKTGRYVTPKLETYPASFQADFSKYRDVLSRPDIFDENAPAKPLRPDTLIGLEADVRQVLSAATNNGYEPEYFQSLENLVEEAVIEAAFTWLTNRNKGEHPVGLSDMAATLIAIAKHHVRVGDKKLKRLKLMRRKVVRYNEGMSAKNRRRLEQFDDLRNTRALLCLPEFLIGRSKSRVDTVAGATDAMYGAAIAILLACPMRMKNLAGLDLEKNLTSIGKGSKRRFRLIVPGEDVKNGVPIEVELFADASKFVAHYLDKCRHVLVGEPTTAFFPSRAGGVRPRASLGYGITNIIRRETGLDVHPHLFRHLAAKLYLEAYHGDYESVRRQLGHKKYDTTLKFYATFDNRRAQERFAEVVLDAMKPGRGRK